MPTRTALEEKFFVLLTAELKRQGVTSSQLRELLPRLAQHTSVYSTTAGATRPSSDDDSSGSSAMTGGQQHVLDIALNGLQMGDKVAIALCEVLLKYNNAAATFRSDGAADGLHAGDVDMWRVQLRANKLTDRSVRHLVLLLETCGKLSLLDIAQNAFSDDGTTQLLTAIVESPHDCEVVYDAGSTDGDLSSRDTRSLHTGRGSVAEAAKGTAPPLSSSTAVTDRYRNHGAGGGGPVMPSRPGRAPVKGDAAAVGTQATNRPAQPQRDSPLLAPSLAHGGAAAAAASAPASAAAVHRSSSPSIEFATLQASSRQPSTLSVDSHNLRQQLQRPTTATTATTAAESLFSISFREELGDGAEPAAAASRGRSGDTVDPLPPPPTTQRQTRSPPSLDQEAMRRGARSPSTATATSVTSRSAFAGGSAEALRKRRQELFSQPSDTGSDDAAPQPSRREKRKEKTAPTDAPREAAEAPQVTAPATAAATVPSPERPATPERVVPTQGTSPFHNSSPKSRANHEPFERNDQLDLTANLNPVLDSVLDLSALMDETGEGLRQPAMFGGAQSVWEIVEAYEEAAALTVRGARSSGVSITDNSNLSAVRADLSAKLPSALIGGDVYNALTVLNISGNHLRTLCTLPSSLLRLDVSNNALTSLKGMAQCKMLTVLNARRNRITQIDGLERNLCLAHLFLGRNRISFVEGLAHLLLLETLDLTYNQLPTQSAIRALSLCGSLHHLLIKGNPFIESLRNQNYKPLLRNLCPTLIMLDDTKLGASRYADALQQGNSYLRQPSMMDTRRPRIPTNSAEILLTSTHLPDNTRSRTGATNVSRGVSSLGRSRSYNTTVAPAGTSSSPNEAESEEQQQSMNLLYLLTRGVTAPTGYGDAANATHTAKSVAQREAKRKEEAEKQKARELNAGGKPIRAEMVKKLAAASKRYLETTIVDRMTSLQQAQVPPPQQQQQSQPPRAGSHNDTPDLDSSPPPRRQPADALGDSPLADIMGYTTAPRTASDEEVLKAYAPTRFRAPSAAGTKKSKSRSRDSARPLATSASPKGRRSASTVAPQRSPSQRAATMDATIEDVYLVGGPGGAPTASSYAALHSPARPAPANPHTTRHEDPERLDCSPIRCFDDSGLLLRSFDEGSERAGSQRPRRRDPLLYKPPQPLPYHSLTAPAAAAKPRASPVYDIAASASTGPTKTVVPRQSSWPPSQSPSSQPAHTRGRIPKLAQNTAAAAAPSPAPSAPVRIDDAQRRRVQLWVEQLRADTDAVQAALATTVQLLEAQRGKGIAAPESSAELPQTYLQERRKCVGIVQDSGMLHDTQVPVDVVVYYGFGKEELESGEPAAGAVVADDAKDKREREEVLRQLRLLGDAKTCLRYMLLLMGDGRERLLQQYVDQVKESLAAG